MTSRTFDQLRTRLLKKLRHAVESKRVSQQVLAERIGISAGHLSHLIKGTHKIATFEIADSIMLALNINLTDLTEKEKENTYGNEN